MDYDICIGHLPLHSDRKLIVGIILMEKNEDSWSFWLTFLQIFFIADSTSAKSRSLLQEQNPFKNLKTAF